MLLPVEQELFVWFDSFFYPEVFYDHFLNSIINFVIINCGSDRFAVEILN